MNNSDETLNIIIKLKDEASKAVEGLKGNLENMKPAFQKMAAVGTAAFLAIGYGIKGAINEATEAAKVQAQLNAVLESTQGIAGVTAESATALADSLSKVTLYQDDTILSAENMLLTFTKIGKDIFPETTETVLNMSTALGQDLKASAVQLGKALQDPIEGVSALRRVGVNFNETQQETIKGLVESGKTMEAQKYILKELNTEFGNSARAAAKADPFGMMKNRVLELKEAIGTSLLPAVEKIADKIKPLVDRITSWIDANPDLTAKILIATAAIAGIVAVVGFLGLVLPAVITGFGLLATGALALGGALASVTAPVWIIIGVIAALIAIGVLLYKHWDEVKTWAIEKWEAIKEFFKETWENIKETFRTAMQAVADFWNEIWQSIVDYLNEKWLAIKTTVLAGWNWLKDEFQKLAEPIRKAWNGLWDGLTSGVTTAWESVKNTVRNSINWIIDKINAVINAINAVAAKGAKVIGFNAPQIPTIPMLAEGGIVNSPTLAMIGEAGPEAVVPLSKMGNMGMGSGISVIINYPEFRSRDDETRMRKMLDDYFRPLLVNHKMSA